MKRATWIFVVALVAGCGTVQTSRVMTGSSQPAYGGNVSVLMDGVALQAEAGSLGCDCVARVKFDQGATIATATGVCLKTH
jgi:hypothetical protein